MKRLSPRLIACSVLFCGAFSIVPKSSIGQTVDYDTARGYVIDAFRHFPGARLRPTRNWSNPNGVTYTIGGISRDALPSDGVGFYPGLLEAIAEIEVTRQDLDAAYWADWTASSEAQLRALVARRINGELNDSGAQTSLGEIRSQMDSLYDQLLDGYAKSEGHRLGTSLSRMHNESYKCSVVIGRPVEFVLLVLPPNATKLAYMRAGDWKWHEFLVNHGNSSAELDWNDMTADEKGRAQLPYSGACTVRLLVTQTDGTTTVTNDLYFPTAGEYHLQPN